MVLRPVSRMQNGVLRFNFRTTNSRLERSQVLSYALEEECKRWRDHLSDTEEKRKVLCGEAIVM